MGLIDIHFHDSTFEFQPSLQLGPTTELPEDATEEDASGALDAGEPPETDSNRRLKLLALLVLLTVVFAVVQRLRSLRD